MNYQIDCYSDIIWVQPNIVGLVGCHSSFLNGKEVITMETFRPTGCRSCIPSTKRNSKRDCARNKCIHLSAKYFRQKENHPEP